MTNTLQKGFTIIASMIVLEIIAIIAIIAAIPNLLEATELKSGSTVGIKATGVKAVVIAYDGRSAPCTWICRIDNGPDAKPRYSEVHLFRSEVDPAPVEVEKR